MSSFLHDHARRRVLFTLFILMIPGSPALANSLCGTMDRPKLNLNIILTMPETAYNFTKTKQELTQENQALIQGWLSKNGIKNVWATNHLSKNMSIGGLASAGYGTSYKMDLLAKPYDAYGTYYCPYFNDVTIDLFYQTIIFIPKDFKKGSCDFEETMKHEWKHHLANLASIKENMEHMEPDIRQIVKEVENRGYISFGNVETRFTEMQQSLEDGLNIYMEMINEASRKRNDAIDSPDEYLRVEQAIEACEKGRPSH